MTTFKRGGWIIAIFCATLLFSQVESKKNVNEFIQYLNQNKESLQYKSFESIQKDDKVEVKVYCQEATQNLLIGIIDGYATEKYFFEMPSPGEIVFTAIFPGTLQAPFIAAPTVEEQKPEAKPQMKAEEQPKEKPAEVKKVKKAKKVKKVTEGKGTKARTAPCPPRVKVTTQQVAMEAVDQYLHIPTKTQDQVLYLKSPAAGRVSQVLGKPGDAVRAGQVLAFIQGASAEEVVKLEADATKAKKTLAARKSQKAPSEKAIQQAEEAYLQAKQLLNQKKALFAVPITSPCNGTLQAVEIAPEGQVSEGMVAFLVVNGDMLEARAEVSDDDLPLFSEKETLPLTFTASGESTSAQLSAIQGRTLVLTIANNLGRYASGADIDLQKLRKRHGQGIAIPDSWIQKDEIGNYVYVVDNNQARQIYVTISGSENGKSLISQGLSSDFRIITSGFKCLKNGKKIKLSPEDKAAVTQPKEGAPSLEPAIPAGPVEPLFALKNRIRVGVTFGRFNLNDEALTTFYPHTFLNLPAIELSYTLKFGIDIWASYKLYSDTRTTTHYENPIKFNLNCNYLGIRYRPTFINLKRFEPFLGVGFNFYSFSEKVTGETLLENFSGSATGFHFEGGTYIKILKFLSGELFLRLNSVKKTLETPTPDETDTLNLGGFEFGFGLVGRF